MLPWSRNKQTRNSNMAAFVHKVGRSLRKDASEGQGWGQWPGLGPKLGPGRRTMDKSRSQTLCRGQIDRPILHSINGKLRHRTSRLVPCPKLIGHLLMPWMCRLYSRLNFESLSRLSGVGMGFGRRICKALAIPESYPAMGLTELMLHGHIVL